MAIDIHDPDAVKVCWSCNRGEDERPTSRCLRKDAHPCGKRHGAGNDRCDLTLGECKARIRRGRNERRDERWTATASDLLDLVHRRHRGRPGETGQWVVVDELQLQDPAQAATSRRLDALALNLWPSRGKLAIAYEIKVDRGDALLELRTPEKREAAMACSTHFYLATPAGIVEPSEVPEDCGLFEARRVGGRITFDEVVPAPAHEPWADPWELAIRLGQRLVAMQARARSRGMVL